MRPLFDITEGWTEPLDLQLLINDVPFDASGMLVDLVLHDKNYEPVTNATINWLAQSTSTVRISPLSSTFLADRSRYTMRVKVTDALGKVSFFPPGSAAIISVTRP